MNPELPAILNRIDQRLQAVGLTDHAASVAAGYKPDCIRSLRRACQNGRGQRIITSEKLAKLAVPLKTDPHWLATGGGA